MKGTEGEFLRINKKYVKHRVADMSELRVGVRAPETKTKVL